MSAPATPFAIGLTNYPQTLLLSKNQYDFIFNAASYFTTPERFIFNFSCDGGQLFELDSFKQSIPFNAAETKQLKIKFQPTRDGMVSFGAEIIHEKLIEYVEMVWKVRDRVDVNLIKTIMAESMHPTKNLLGFKQTLPAFIDNTGLPQYSQAQAAEELNNINSPRPQIDPVSGQTISQSPISQDQKDVLLVNLARATFMQAPAYGYQLLKQVKESTARHMWLLAFLPTGILLDYKSALNEIMELKEESEKEHFFEIIADFLANDNPQDAAMIALNITHEHKRDHILCDIIFTIVNSQPEVASNLVFQIADESLRVKVLFEVIKQMAAKNKDQAVDSLKNLIQNILSAANTDFIKKCTIFLADLTSPQAVYDLIEKFPSNEKATLLEQLQGYLKIQVQEKKTRIERVPLGTIGYSFMAVAQSYSPAIETLTHLGGSFSLGFLNEQKRTNCVLLNLFGFNFIYAPGFQQAALELHSEMQRDLTYLIYPSRNGLDQSEWGSLKDLLDQFCTKRANAFPSPTFVINLDFIPYLSHPTVILGNDSEVTSVLAQKLQQFLGSQANVLINDSFFRGGKLLTDLQTVLPSPKFKVINMVITYNFFNSYPLLKTLLKALI